jgi:hypothetical protein
MLDALQIPESDPERPLVILLDQSRSTHKIENLDHVYRAIVAGCPHCDVEMIDIDALDAVEQVRTVSQASVIVGRHGSDLAHVVWMAESARKFLIEIVPQGYRCRDWYETAAKVAGVMYRRVMNPAPDATGQLKRCYGSDDLCRSAQCHELLQDQRVELDIETFNGTWAEVAEVLSVKNARN